MKKRFDVILLNEVWELLKNIDEKARENFLYNIDKSKFLNDPKLLKKLDSEIWEFRTKHSKLQYRLFSFWDKTDGKDTLIISTHGIIKKTDKVPKQEIEKAREIMKRYFENK